MTTYAPLLVFWGFAAVTALLFIRGAYRADSQ